MLEEEIDEDARITVMVNLPIEYSDKPVTPFGGMALMKRFIDQTGIERRLFNMAHNAPLVYGLICVFMAMLLGWISSVLFRRPA